VRLPKSLHQALVDRAEREGVSLNLFVTNALSRTVAVSGKGKR
jgi:predicted HicB family RNase H-like nuclease